MTLECYIPVTKIQPGLTEAPRHCELPSPSALNLSGAYTFNYDYPLSRTVNFQHELIRQMTGLDLLVLGRVDYEQIYREEADSSSVSASRIPGMLNRETTDGKYGIWGHEIENLVFEGIEVDEGKREITFVIGS
jgi:hypothetical protein